MTRTLSICVAVFGFVATMDACDWAAEPAVTVDPEAKQVLDRFATFSQSVQGFHVVSHFRLERESMGNAQKTEIHMNWSAERPNKLSVTCNDASVGTIVCDGKELMIAFKGACAAGPAPATWSVVADNPAFKGAVLLGNAMGAIMLLTGKDFAESFKDLNPEFPQMNVSYTGRVQLDGHDCHLLRFSNGPVAIELWIDAGEQPLLRKSAPVFSPEVLAEINRQNREHVKKQAERADAPMPEIPDVKFAMSTTYDNWEIDPDFPANAFAIRLPTSLQNVESIEALTKKREPSQLIGKPAPSVELDLAAGGRFDLAEHKNKNIVILDFWATWCAPCIMGMPVIDNVAKRYHDQGVRLYAVNRQESAEEVRKFLETMKFDLAVPLDKHGALAAAFDVEGIPQTVIIGSDGTVQAVHVGFTPSLGEELAQELDALIAGKNLAAESLATKKEEAEANQSVK